MTGWYRRSIWIETLLMTAALLAAGGGWALADATAPAATGPTTSADWPQFMGPSRDGIAPNSPKLLDAWPKEGPKRVWTSTTLPAAPACGIGNPVVAGGRVFTYADTPLPLAGTIPFTAEFLAYWGWVADLPDDLGKKIDEAQSNKKRQACKNKEDVDAYANEFLATLDADQVRKFGDAIRTRLAPVTGAFKTADLAWMASYQGKEIKTRQEFMNLFGTRWYNFAHWEPPMVPKHAAKMYKDQQSGDVLVCLDGATGKELWRKEFVVPTPYAPTNPVWYGCSGTPTVVKDKVYFAGRGGVYCLDATKNGEVVWQAKTGSSHTSPLVLDGVAYFMAGELAAFNAETGQVLWRQPIVKNVYSSPKAWTQDGKTYLLCTFGAPDPTAVCCVDLADGKILWQVGTGLYLNATPATAGDIMVVRGKNGAAAFRISTQKAEPLWKKDEGDAGTSPIIYQDHVYLAGKTYSSQVIRVVDLKTGEITLKHDQYSTTCTNPIVAEGKIFTLCGELPIAYKATPDKFELVGEMPKVKAAGCSAPALVDGRLYLRLRDAIACYDLTGK
jgi:outer membrane protein assembly factor BamB